MVNTYLPGFTTGYHSTNEQNKLYGVKKSRHELANFKQIIYFYVFSNFSIHGKINLFSIMFIKCNI